jgi:hypothetical protein
MNIIEQVWTYMEQEKVKRAPTKLQQLWEVLQDIWSSVPRHVNELCKAKGFHTKYLTFIVLTIPALILLYSYHIHLLSYNII